MGLLHGGAEAAKREIRRLAGLAAQASTSDRDLFLAEAMGIAAGAKFFAPASGRRMLVEIGEAARGDRDLRTWRPR